MPQAFPDIFSGSKKTVDFSIPVCYYISCAEAQAFLQMGV